MHNQKHKDDSLSTSTHRDRIKAPQAILSLLNH